jgi:hypothetical protein
MCTNTLTELFAHNNWQALSKIWSLEGIPHILMPTSPNLIPSYACFTFPSAPSGVFHDAFPQFPETLPDENTPLPTYAPCLPYSSYVAFFFLELYDDPTALPRMVQKFCSSSYNPLPGAQTKHPDLANYNPAVPEALMQKYKDLRNAAVERALVEAGEDMAKVNAEKQAEAHNSAPAGAPLSSNHETAHNQQALAPPAAPRQHESVMTPPAGNMTLNSQQLPAQLFQPQQTQPPFPTQQPQLPQQPQQPGVLHDSATQQGQMPIQSQQTVPMQHFDHTVNQNNTPSRVQGEQSGPVMAVQQGQWAQQY